MRECWRRGFRAFLLWVYRGAMLSWPFSLKENGTATIFPLTSTGEML
jgi:hypothetical protein